jgi:hypothetical protein
MDDFFKKTPIFLIYCYISGLLVTLLGLHASRLLGVVNIGLLNPIYVLTGFWGALFVYVFLSLLNQVRKNRIDRRIKLVNKWVKNSLLIKTVYKCFHVIKGTSLFPAFMLCLTVLVIITDGSMRGLAICSGMFAWILLTLVFEIHFAPSPSRDLGDELGKLVLLDSWVKNQLFLPTVVLCLSFGSLIWPSVMQIYGGGKLLTVHVSSNSGLVDKNKNYEAYINMSGFIYLKDPSANQWFALRSEQLDGFEILDDRRKK